MFDLYTYATSSAHKAETEKVKYISTCWQILSFWVFRIRKATIKYLILPIHVRDWVIGTIWEYC